MQSESAIQGLRDCLMQHPCYRMSCDGSADLNDSIVEHNNKRPDENAADLTLHTLVESISDYASTLDKALSKALSVSSRSKELATYLSFASIVDVVGHTLTSRNWNKVRRLCTRYCKAPGK